MNSDSPTIETESPESQAVESEYQELLVESRVPSRESGLSQESDSRVRVESRVSQVLSL